MLLNDVQKAIEVLRGRGWTHAAIAKELGVQVGAIDTWWAGTRHPRMSILTLEALERLAALNPPKKWARKPVA